MCKYVCVCVYASACGFDGVLMQAYLPVEYSQVERTLLPSASPLPAALAANPIPNSKHLNLFMHLSCANGVAVVSNEIKTNGGTTQDGDEEGKGSEVTQGKGGEWRDGERESVIALGMCRLSGVHCDWTRLGCRLACNLQGRFYMAPSWSTCDPLSCFSSPPPSPSPHSS